MRTKSHKQQRVNVITLGCSKNTVDSENLMGQLVANDFDVRHNSSKVADVVIINTCGFIDLAKAESVDTILEYAELKRKKKIQSLYVTGCLSQRYKDNLEAEIKEVDAFFGTLEMPRLLATLNADYKHELLGERILSTPSHFAYLKISEGCNRTCSFCAIPLMRGKHVSRTIESLVMEAQKLARMGVKELILIAQELTYYGLDIYKKRELPQLLDALQQVEGIAWIRLHYAYPSKFPLEIFDAMLNNSKVCHYLDLPLQHANDSVLNRMRRQTTQAEMIELINYARTKIPDIALRTTFLVGFPGETEAEFQDLCDFVIAQRFDRVGVFQYSHEEDTSAHLMVDDVSPEIKEARANKIMAIQQEISLEKNKAHIGKTLKVLFDKKEGGFFVGRTQFDSPEVDNEVLVDATNNYIRTGDFANVLINEATEYDLMGVLSSDLLVAL